MFSTCLARDEKKKKKKKNTATKAAMREGVFFIRGGLLKECGVNEQRLPPPLVGVIFCSFERTKE